MMKTQFSVRKHHTLLWFFSLMLFCSLLASNANAQLVPQDTIREEFKKHWSRSFFLALDSNHQIELLQNTPFIIDDLKNVSYAQFLNSNAAGSEVYIRDIDFYNRYSPAEQQLVLLRSEMYKVYGIH